eukprot:3371425-Rhodomonas_salina.1
MPGKLNLRGQVFASLFSFSRVFFPNLLFSFSNSFFAVDTRYCRMVGASRSTELAYGGRISRWIRGTELANGGRS